MDSLVAALGGYVESTRAEDSRSLTVLRIPADQLDSFIHTVGKWGDLKEKRVTTVDVTEQTFDLEARIRNLATVRDRLRAHLASAMETQDIIAVERELARVQSELEGLENRLARSRTDVAYAQVALSLERRRVLGPLGLIVSASAQLISKLFVIR